VIPKDHYGGGTVLIWDCGTYENITEKENGIKPAKKAIEAGHFLFRLDGEKLKGGWALQRMLANEPENWLLVKMDDEEADARRNPVSTQPKSVKSGRTMSEIAEDNDPS
jgi:DNA ligase D-like protein (predicted 3'-phosphoesterase)